MALRQVQILAFAAAISTFGWATCQADPSDWNTPYDELFDQPEAQVSSYLNERGSEVRRLILPGKTVATQTRVGGKIKTLVSDISGRGAVLCVWMIYADTRAALEANGDADGSVAAERLDIAMSRINRFVQENSIKHTPIWNLENAYQARLEEIRHDGSAAEILDGFGELVSGLESQTPKQFDRDLGIFLSVPRLPAMDPCV
jgi:hypothetical protein